MNDTPTPQSPDFGDPLAVLRACHDDMLAQCDALETLPAHLREHGLDADARGRIARSVQFFTTVALQHHQDEENDLFPILNRQSLKLADIVFGLRKDHQQLHRLWEQLLADFKTGPALAQDDGFAGRVSEFCNAYREHIRRETRGLFGMAQHILSSQQLKDIGRAMARRRGIRG